MTATATPTPTPTPTVTGLWRYPVKSMGGEPIDRARLMPGTIHRVEGDREWGVFDAATGKLLSAKSVGALLDARARWAGGETVIDLPGGATVVAGTDEAARAIGAWLGRDVVLRRGGITETATIDVELDEGEGDGPTGLDSFATQPGMLYDSQSTLHLIGTASAAAIDRDHAAGGGDARRYRPNVVVDGIPELAEDGWVGGDVQLGGDGGVIAHVRKRTGRCVLVSRAQPGVDADRALLRFLKATRAFSVGVYLDPRGPGEVGIGDRVARVTVGG